MNLTEQQWMLVILAIAAALMALTVWRAHRNKTVQFDMLDLIMADGKVDKIAFAFMVAFAVSTWVIVDMEIKGKLDSGTFGLWLGAWVGPLVVKVVFGKNEMPGTSTSTTVVQQTTEVKS